MEQLDSPEFYTIGWIAALPIERAAATALLNDRHDAPKSFHQHPSDTNSYTWGHIGKHNIVIVSLPAGVYGTISAAHTASNLIHSLPHIRIGLLVGIGGAIARPDQGRDIRLGDIVVSQPDGTTGGVVQYDLGKAKLGEVWERKGSLDKPPPVLLHALASLQAEHEIEPSKVPGLLQAMWTAKPKMKTQKNDFTYQGLENDHLFSSDYDHIGGSTCDKCDQSQEVNRDIRESTEPEIHYGVIASGNTLIKDANTRDRIFEVVGEQCMCVEMEAAGLMDHFPCLVIRGVCDYADSHKNDRWQRYASATAAAFAAELLEYIPTTQLEATRRVVDIVESLQVRFDQLHPAILETHHVVKDMKSETHNTNINRWLSPPDHLTNLKLAKERRYQDTGTWLLDSSAYKEWKNGSRRHLWFYGLAGCGKTILSTWIIDDLLQTNTYATFIFFFDFNDPGKQTVESLLRSLASQLYRLGGEATMRLDYLFTSHDNGKIQLDASTLSGFFKSAIKLDKKVAIVVDALDECTTRKQLLHWLQDLASTNVQLIVTGRPEAEFYDKIPQYFDDKNCIILDKKAVNLDIRSYVITRLNQDPDFVEMELSQDLQHEILNKVGDGADGMFRWAACQLDSFTSCLSPHEIKTALKSLPSDLDETYSRMLRNIPVKYQSGAIRLLQFLVYTKRPLLLVEAVEVIATEIEQEPRGFNEDRRLSQKTNVLRYCPSLISIAQATKEFRTESVEELHLAHFSVKEYLLKQNTFFFEIASVTITRTCLSYLTDIKGSRNEIKKKFPMAQYAAMFWMNYAASAEIVGDIVNFVQNEVTFQRWCRLYQADRPWESNPGSAKASKLYYTCLGGLSGVARSLVNKDANVNAQGGYYGNALQAGSVGGHQEIVQLLLDKGANVNAQGGYYGNALQAASEEGHQEIVRLLLDKGANAQGSYYSNALYAASNKGHQEIVQLLLDKGANVNAQGGGYGNALQAASLRGHQEIIQLLLDKGANVNAQGGEYGNALQAASNKGHQEIVQLLLDKGANVNTQGGRYGNALYAASEEGHQEIVQLLLDKGANVNAQGGECGNALQAASNKGHQEIVQLLLDKGANVNAQGGEYSNAFQAASLGGHQEIVQLLIQRGAES